jgi:hypothetical protein
VNAMRPSRTLIFAMRSVVIIDFSGLEIRPA